MLRSWQRPMARSSTGMALAGPPGAGDSRPTPKDACMTAAGVIDRLGNPERFFALGASLGKRPQLGKAPGQSQARESTAGRTILAEAL